MRGAWLPMLLAPLAVLGPDQRPTDLGPQSYGLVPAYRDGVEAEVAAPRELNRVSHAASNGPVVGSGSEAPSAVVENAQLMASTSLPTKVPVHWDRAVEVAWGKPGDRRVIAYFHGMCGDITAFRSFASVAQEHGTLIAVPTHPVKISRGVSSGAPIWEARTGAFWPQLKLFPGCAANLSTATT